MKEFRPQPGGMHPWRLDLGHVYTYRQCHRFCDHFIVKCKHHYRNALNPFLNGTKKR